MIEGRHVKLLGHGGDPRKLGNVDHVKATIRAIVEACGMRVLGLHEYDVEIELEKLRAVPFEDEGGVTVVGVLSTSHASIHTWPARGFFVLDVYSCRDFERSHVRDVLFRSFCRHDDAAMHAHSVAVVSVEPSAWLADVVPRDERAVVDYLRGGLTLRETDLSFALEMPPDWREPAPEFR